MAEGNSQIAGGQSRTYRQHDKLLAAEVLAVVGPCKVLHLGACNASFLSELADMGCDLRDGAAESAPFESGRPAVAPMPLTSDTVILSYPFVAGMLDFPHELQALRPGVGRNLVVLPPVSDAAPAGTLAPNTGSIIAAAIAAGYRRHPAAYEVADFERSNSKRFSRPLFFEIIPDPVLECWPLQRLRAERDLHMDMTREDGARSDAHLVRYALAANWIRPGDAVLDCACGLGYGTAVLAARSPGEQFLGVDIDPGSVAYASDNFGGWGINYVAASATQLDRIADRSIDTLVSFETLEHLEDYSIFLDEAARVLKPGGRIIVSVPNLWMDESGRDPNPHHHHVFDYAKCRDALAAHFRIEARYSQSAPGGTVLLDAPRQLREQPLSSTDDPADTEWWIVVAAVVTPANDKSQTTSLHIERQLALGTKELAAGRDDAARSAYRAGIDMAKAALRGFLEPPGPNHSPATLGEMRDICSIAHRCALAEHSMADYRRAPGLFWRQVNARHADSTVQRRAAEDRDAEFAAKIHEIGQLRGELERLRATTTIRALLPLRLKEVFLVILPRLLARLFGRSP
jgi:2-polyprenyl-3-methyl-5-hydroxy-6-metoxy-1,4-benzoquinol methylase